MGHDGSPRRATSANRAKHRAGARSWPTRRWCHRGSHSGATYLRDASTTRDSDNGCADDACTRECSGSSELRARTTFAGRATGPTGHRTVLSRARLQPRRSSRRTDLCARVGASAAASRCSRRFAVPHRGSYARARSRRAGLSDLSTTRTDTYATRASSSSASGRGRSYARFGSRANGASARARTSTCAGGADSVASASGTTSANGLAFRRSRTAPHGDGGACGGRDGIRCTRPATARAAAAVCGSHSAATATGICRTRRARANGGSRSDPARSTAMVASSRPLVAATWARRRDTTVRKHDQSHSGKRNSHDECARAACGTSRQRHSRPTHWHGRDHAYRLD